MIGTWDSATKTCTLTTDVYETIQIDSDHITLDGNGYTITGTGTAYGVYLPYKRTDVTVKNLNIKEFPYGIYLSYFSNNNTLTGNTTSNNWHGIYLRHSSNNTLTGNTTLNKYYTGIVGTVSNNNTLTNNTTLNSWYGIFFTSSSNNTWTNNNASNHRYGIFLQLFSNNTLTGNTTSNNSIGIYSLYSSNNTLTNNNASNNSYMGVSLRSSNNITLIGNTACNNWQYDFYCVSCSILTESDNICDKPNWCPINCIPCRIVDTIPPITTATISGILGDNGWYISNVQVTLTVVDNAGGSGVKKLEYSFDGTTWNTYSVPFTISNEGTTIVYYKSTDNAGNVETTKSTTIKIDKTPPSTTAIISGTSGSNGWYVLDVTIEVTATDTVSGVKTINYTINGATNTVSGNRTSFTLTTDGRYTITYYAVDNAGNIEAQKSMSINIDRTAPSIITVTATPNILWPPNHKMVDVRIDGSAIDDMSGIASIVITVTDEYGIYNMTVPGFGSMIQLEAWKKGTDRDGRHYTITVVATDMAGNQSTAITQVIVPHDMRR